MAGFIAGKRDTDSESSPTGAGRVVTSKEEGAANQNQGKRPRDQSPASLRVNEIAGAQTLDRVRKARATALRPKYRLLDDDGYVSSAIINKLDLSEEEVRLIHQATADLYKQAAVAVVKSMKEDPARSDPGAGVRAFMVVPFDFNVPFDRYAELLVARIGREKAGEVLISIPVEFSFADFGRNEAQFKVHGEIDPDAPEAGRQVQITGVDPESGKQVFRTTSFSSRMALSYPGVFDLEMNPLAP